MENVVGADFLMDALIVVDLVEWRRVEFRTNHGVAVLYRRATLRMVSKRFH